MSRVVSLCGAGMSAAPPLSLPTTFEFFERIMGEASSPNHPFKQSDVNWPLRGLLTAMFESSDVAVHDLETFYQFLEWIGTTNPKFIKLTGFFLNQAAHQRWLSGSSIGLEEVPLTLRSMEEHYQLALSWFDKVRDLLRQSFHREYFVSSTRGNSANDVYLPLVELLSQVNSSTSPTLRVPIFTLNWDTSWEAMLANEEANRKLREVLGISPESQMVMDGFSRLEIDRIYEPLLWKKNIEHQGITLVRLHGSICWRRDKGTGCVYHVTTPEPPGDYTGQEPCLIYPAEKEGAVAKEPWVSLLALLVETLQSANVLLIVGYSFRDEHLNLLLSRAMGSNDRLRLVAVNPTRFSKLASSNATANTFFESLDKSKFSYVERGWPEAIAECKELIERFQTTA